MAHTTLHLDEAVDRLGDKGLYLEIAQAFVTALPDILHNLESARGRADWPELRRLAHSVKSNCATLGAEEVRQAAYALETACHDGDAKAASERFRTLTARLDDLRETLNNLR